MSVQSRNIVALFLVVFLLATPFVFGANILDQILRPFAGTNFGQTYNAYYYFVDGVLFIVLFIFLSKFALGKKFEGQPAVPIIIGIVGGIGMAVFELQTGFNIGKMWWFFGLIFFLLFAAGIYYIAKQFGANTLIAFSVAYIFFYVLVQNTAPSLLAQIMQLDWLGGLISILFILAIIGLIYGIIKLVKDIKSGNKDWNASEETANKNKNSWGSLFNNEKRAAKKFQKAETEGKAFEEQLGKLRELEQTLKNQEIKTREDFLKQLTELENALNMTWRMQEGIQKVISKIGQPEYAQYAANIQGYANQLNEYINTIRRVITELKEKGDKIITDEKEEFDIGKRIAKATQTIALDEQQLVNAEKDYAFIEQLDPEYYELMKGRIANVNAKITESFISKDDQARLRTDYLTQIEKLDKANEQTIQKMLDLTTKNNFETLRFQYMSRLYGLDFIKSQSLAQLFKYVKQLRENVTKIIDFKTRFNAEITKVEDLIKRKIDTLDQTELELNKDLEEIMNEMITQYKSIDQIRIKYYLAIHTILQKIIAQTENFKQGNIVPDFTPDTTQLVTLSQNVQADVSNLKGNKKSKNREILVKDIRGKIRSVTKELKSLFVEDKKTKKISVNTTIFNNIKEHKQKLETDLQSVKRTDTKVAEAQK